MVIDTSAFLAILLNAPERRRFNEAIEAADSRVVSVASFVETSIVIETRLGAEGLRDLDLFLGVAGIEPWRLISNKATRPAERSANSAKDATRRV